MFAVVPLRGFDSAKTRLADRLTAEHRARIAAAVADRVVTACRARGWKVAVVSSAQDVAVWCAERSLPLLPDPGGGLDAAAAAGVSIATGPWAVVHGDLPLVTAHDLARVEGWVEEGFTVLAPSRDGGTNVIVGLGNFEFAYGPGSFVRHLARAHRPRVVVRTGLAMELDTPADLAATLRHRGGWWLAGFLS